MGLIKIKVRVSKIHFGLVKLQICSFLAQKRIAREQEAYLGEGIDDERIKDDRNQYSIPYL